MSRDLSAKECYMLNLASIQSGRGNITEAILNMVESNTGKPLYEDAIKYYKKYPVLIGHFHAAAGFYLRYPKAIVEKVLANIESQLEEYAVKDKDTPDNKIGLWFNGELRNGYMLDRNDEAFYEHINELMIAETTKGK